MGLYRREGSPFWYYKFKVGGRTYRGSTGKRQKSEALQVELEERRKVTMPAAEKRGEVTLGAAADGWLEDEGKRMADGKNNESRVRKLFGELVGRPGRDAGVKRYGLSRGLKLHDLANEDITKLVRARRQEGNSDATINREIALVRSIIRYARVKLNARVPELDLNEFVEDEGEGRLRFLSLEEERRLLDALDPLARFTPEQWAAIPARTRRQHQDQFDLVVFLLDTGGRYGEGAGVAWDVVDFDRNEINLYRDKVGSEGVLQLTKRLRAVLLRRWNERDPGCPWIFPGYGERGGPRGHSTKGIKKAMDRVGINDEYIVARFGRATPAHTLRHTFASRLVQAGVSLKKVSVLLGHSSVKTTEIYAHLAPCDAAAEAARVLDQIHAPRPVAKVIELSGPHDRGGSTASTEGAQKVTHPEGAHQEVAVRG